MDEMETAQLQEEMERSPHFAEDEMEEGLQVDQETKDKVLSRTTSKDVPSDIEEYIRNNRINEVVKTALNKTLREKPADPLAAIAGQLFLSAKKSFPVFEKFEAKKVYLHDSLTCQSLQVSVYLNYQGRTLMRHRHTFTYDEAQQKNFLWDKPDEMAGLQKSIELIHEEINPKLAGKTISSSIEADNLLTEVLQPTEGGEEEAHRTNIIRACSEALVFGVAKCFSPNDIVQGLFQSFYPPNEEQDGLRNTKLMMTVLNGGKSVSSLVKFSKIYLIVDAAELTKQNIDPTEIVKFFQKFLTGIKKCFQGTKGGEAAFKIGIDGSFFNANATIIESLKMMEEAIALSGANDDSRKVFQIGVNCDADNSFNKDPKDPGKYEQEGQKAQFDEAGMIEYYCKLFTEHPLITYIEDAFAQFDFSAHRNFREKIHNEFSHVNMGLKQLFARGGLKRLKQVTDFSEIDAKDQNRDKVVSPDTDGEQASVKGGKKEKTPPTPDQKKRTPAAGGEDFSLQEFPEPDPNDPNKHKVTPDCVHINLQNSSIVTMSHVLKFFTHTDSYLDEEQQFSLIIDDRQVDSHEATQVVDLALGMGAAYLNVKGVAKTEKAAKLLRFCEIKSQMFHSDQ